VRSEIHFGRANVVICLLSEDWAMANRLHYSVREGKFAVSRDKPCI